MNDDDDFGLNEIFGSIKYADIDADDKKVKNLQQQIDVLDKAYYHNLDIIQEIQNKINKFLDKLQENSTKTTIVWPDRAKHVREFQSKLRDIFSKIE